MRPFHFTIGVIVLLGLLSSCQDTPVEAGFEDMIDFTIYDYMADSAAFSSFLAICEAGGIARTLSAYNPENLKYTLFLPDNEAVDRFIEESDRFSSLQELLSDAAYASSLSRYHVVDIDINADDFPFGALPEYTLSGDILTVSFVVEEDTSYYLINNQAPVVLPNVEASNGWVHVISEMLKPVVSTTYDWLSLNGGYSIFLEAADATGFSELLDLNIKDENETRRPFTLFVEHDSVYNRRGITSFEDLAARISPEDENYTSLTNPLYNFVGYHLLTDIHFMDDFAEDNTNYTTYSDIPLNVNGMGLDILINKGKMVFDTLISGEDTTFVDYIGFYFDYCNVLTQSGAIHFIDQVMEQVRPSRQIQTFRFLEEPLFDEYREEPGEYLIEDEDALEYITWEGADLIYVKEADEDFPTWEQDYIALEGDFTVSYQIPNIVQGNYSVFIRANAYYALNALVEVYIDGKKLGGLIDLTSGGTSNYPFAKVELGTINFLKYEGHLVEVRSLIPGLFRWDNIRFEPF
jgi:uncharacterized surface protein with fasciclin (FAS1) repeats